MRKCVTMFERDPKTFRVFDKVQEGAEWAASGEGVAMLKHDGTCCMVKDGLLYKRYDGSKGKYLPPDFVPAEGAESHWLGWRPVGKGPEDRWHNEAWDELGGEVTLADGTFELVGPRVNGNPDHHETHHFERHGNVIYKDIPRTFEAIKSWLSDKDIEGIVFHHPDGRMVKIKGKDFGLKRKALAAK